LGPFTVTFWPSTLAVTPAGTATGFLPMRDMVSLPSSVSEHRAEDLAADVLLARLVIGHDAFRRRENRDAESVVDARQRLDRGIDPAARFGDPRNLADHRPAVEIFQFDLELGAAVAVLDRRIAADVALALEHVEHVGAQLGSRARHLGLVAQRRVADAGDHVAERIVQRHRAILLTSST